MKKVVLAVAAFFAMTVGAAQAQSNVVKVNILSPVVSTGSVFYERAIADDKSLQLGVFYTGFSIGDTKFSGFGITPEFRKYMSSAKQAPEGFYLAPFLRYQSFNLKTEYSDWSSDGGTKTAEASYNTIGGGLLIGKQWVFADRFVLDTFFGPSYNNGNIKAKDGSSEDQFETGAFGGFGIRTGIALGIKF